MVFFAHGRIAGIVEHHDHDRDVLVLRQRQALGDRVVHERAVADDRDDRPVFHRQLGAKRQTQPLPQSAGGDAEEAERTLEVDMLNNRTPAGDGLVDKDRVVGQHITERGT